METSKPHKQIVQYMMSMTDEQLVVLVKSYQYLQSNGNFWDQKFHNLGEKISKELGVSYDVELTLRYVQDEVFRRYVLLTETDVVILNPEDVC